MESFYLLLYVRLLYNMCYICTHVRGESSGCPDKFINLGIEGPYTSASNNPTDNP